MRLSIGYLVKKYDAATVFVGVATVVVIVELSLMRLFVPSPPVPEDQEFNALMSQLCSDISVLDVTRKINLWEQESSHLVARLSSDPNIWQRDLVSLYAFSEQVVVEEIVAGVPDLRAQQILEADFALSQMSLQSVMTGRTPLANINGKIYTIGDKILIMGGEIVMLVVEVNSTHVVVQLAESIDESATTRDLYLLPNTRIVIGGSKE